MPLLYVEARLRKELEDIKVEESQMDGDLAKRKEWLRERKISIMRKLGQKVNIQSELEQQAYEETIEMNTEIRRLRQQKEALMNDIELLKTNKRQKCSMCMHCRHPDPHD
jgi:chromosome segregation ATPase